MSNDNNENLSQNDNKDDFDELVNKIANLADSGTHTDQAEADAVLASEEDNEPENLDSPDSEDDGFEGANLVTLFDDDGNEYEFELLDYVDYEDKLYAVMIPSELSDAEDDQVAVIMETYFEGNEPNFVFVDNEELAQKILDAYSAESGD